jgi:hypothetical protein
MVAAPFGQWQLGLWRGWREWGERSTVVTNFDTARKNACAIFGRVGALQNTKDDIE